MEPDGSLPCSQESATGPCPEPDQSNPYHPIVFLKLRPSDCFAVLLVPIGAPKVPTRNFTLLIYILLLQAYSYISENEAACSSETSVNIYQTT
jgi:hypothetical protein